MRTECICPVYAYAYIYCIQDIRFPYYLKVQHQQGQMGHTYRIACKNFAELDYYRHLCKDIPDYLALSAIRRGNDDEYRQVLDGDMLSQMSDEDIRNWTDGKTFEFVGPVRNAYIGDTF